MCHAVLQDPAFFHFLTRIDEEFASGARLGRCPGCAGPLHVADFPRKPRGCPAAVREDYSWRLSFTCGRCDGRAHKAVKRRVPDSYEFHSHEPTPTRLGRIRSRAPPVSSKFQLRIGRQCHGYCTCMRDAPTKTPFSMQRPRMHECVSAPNPGTILEINRQSVR